MAQSYVVGVAECLLIELACDEYASKEEICLKTGAIVEMILSDEERDCLIQKLEERNQNYADNQNFQIIIENITKS